MWRVKEDSDSVDFKCDNLYCNSLYRISMIPEYGAYKVTKLEQSLFE